MKILNQKRWDIVRRHWKLALPSLAASMFSLYGALTSSGKWNFLLLWLLGTLMCFCVLSHYDPEEKRPLADRISAWIFLCAAFLGILLERRFEYCLLLALFSFSVYEGSIRAGLKLLIPFFVLLVMAPEQVFFNTFFSYPLRVLAAFLTAGFLGLFGLNVESAGTELSMDGADITVTAACSGIEQLEIMLLVGFLLVLTMQNRFLPALFHYLLILPSLVIANVFRLSLTLILYKMIGGAVFDPKAHEILGYLMVVVAFLLLYCGGFLFRDDSDAAPHIPEKKKTEEKS